MKIAIPSAAKGFFSSFHQSLKSDENIMIACSSEDEAISIYNQVLFFIASSNNPVSVFYFPSFDTVPYDRISPNNAILAERAKVLSELALAPEGRKILVTNAANFLVKLPPPSTFIASSLTLKKGVKYSLKEFSSFLVDNGFSRTQTAIDGGDFAVRGDIIDVVLQEMSAYRVNFSWDKIESIKQYDPASQLSSKSQDTLSISPASEIILNDETIKNFKGNYLTTFGVNYANQPVYEALIEGRKFPGFEYLLPLFYNELSSIFDYLANARVIYDNLSLQAIAEFEASFLDFHSSRLQSNKVPSNGFYPVLSPEKLYLTASQVKESLGKYSNIFIDPGATEDKPALKVDIKLIDDFKDEEALKKTKFDKLVDLARENKDKTIIICCRSTSGFERLKSMGASAGYKINNITTIAGAKAGTSLLNVAKLHLKSGFHTDKYLFISEQNIFGEKFAGNQTSKRRLKNILTELDSLEEGELVVHKEHGIGKFMAVETLQVGGYPHDCLKILYAGNDRLYVPVENIELIKKYGNFEAELDKLGGTSWQKRKAKIKNRINDIAEELLKVAASRKLAVTIPVEYDTAAYDKFCAKFKYTETEDQLRSIEDIKQDLTSGELMDRLICGDVGFGKTEVAMRAVFMIAANTDEPAQIAIIAPTTILCKQHYLNFLERFKDFGFNILQLSRLVKQSEVKSIKDQIKNGKATIIIGTHALLAKNIEFSNLKLLIIDEEQHFGVGQKERLKQLKSEVHVLSLSATPIPRTLQMSLTGLKELSLIATPPLDRLAVRTTVMPFDAVILRDALLREHFRGGKSFYVCPRIKDIHDIEKKLQEIVPELKYKIAHGQMPPSLVENVMNDFYDGKFDILLSTTIIESGIDVATANTMIIHKADQLGLSQLYQLRGRVGRSNARGYAYLTLSNHKKITKHAVKRLEIMQTVDSLGAGFAIASHDMDIRGFGNLVGEEQSGQVREVGIELYQEMLDEQIALLKNDHAALQKDNFSTTINLGLPIFISNDYIADSGLRLGIYRRIGNLATLDELEHFKNEMIDRFGALPLEFENLLTTVKIKQICQSLKIESLDAGKGGFVIKFFANSNVADMVIKFVSLYPRDAKIKPDNKLIFVKNLNDKNIIGEATDLLNKLAQS